MAITSFFLPNTEDSSYMQGPATPGGSYQACEWPPAAAGMKATDTEALLAPKHLIKEIQWKFNKVHLPILYPCTHGDLHTLAGASVQWGEATLPSSSPENGPELSQGAVDLPAYTDHTFNTIFYLPHFSNPQPLHSSPHGTDWIILQPRRKIEGSEKWWHDR